jgi:hypothetical protein
MHRPYTNKDKADVMNRLFGIVEETLFYRADEVSDKIMFMRKITLKLLWNQKNVLVLSLE